MAVQIQVNSQLVQVRSLGMCKPMQHCATYIQNPFLYAMKIPHSADKMSQDESPQPFNIQRKGSKTKQSRERLVSSHFSSVGGQLSSTVAVGKCLISKPKQTLV